jgi:TolB-like protein
MKRFFSLLFVLMTGALLRAQEPVALDNAIKNAAAELGAVLARGSKVAVLNFSGGSERLGNYVIEELTGAIVNQRLLTVVDRQQLDLIRKERNFQLSGEVSDESAQEIGRLLGAQTIVSGSMENIGAIYRVRIRAIEVISASIQASYSADVKNDSVVQALMTGAGGGTAAGPSAGAGTPIIPQDTYRDFSTARRVGAGFLNWIYGLGSYTMGDWIGGLVVTAADVGGLVLMINGVRSGSDGGYYDGDGGSDAKIYAGYGLIIAGTIFGHIRPFFFHRPRPKNSAAGLDNFDIALVPGREGFEGVRFSYGFSY